MLVVILILAFNLDLGWRMALILKLRSLVLSLLYKEIRLRISQGMVLAAWYVVITLGQRHSVWVAHGQHFSLPPLPSLSSSLYLSFLSPLSLATPFSSSLSLSPPPSPYLAILNRRVYSLVPFSGREFPFAYPVSPSNIP